MTASENFTSVLDPEFIESLPRGNSAEAAVQIIEKLWSENSWESIWIKRAIFLRPENGFGDPQNPEFWMERALTIVLWHITGRNTSLIPVIAQTATAYPDDDNRALLFQQAARDAEIIYHRASALGMMKPEAIGAATDRLLGKIAALFMNLSIDIAMLGDQP